MIMGSKNNLEGRERSNQKVDLGTIPHLFTLLFSQNYFLLLQQRWKEVFIHHIALKKKKKM